MTFVVAFDEAVRNALVELDEILELGAVADDLQPRVTRGELTLEEAWELMLERSAGSGEGAS